MATRAGEVEIAIQAQFAEFDRDLRQLRTRVAQFERGASASMRTFEQSTRRVTNAIMGLVGGIGALEATRRSIGVLANFGQEMSTVRAITGATEAQFADLTAEAERLGATTRFSASQAAQGMTFLARAGFSTSEVLGATEGALRLAQSGSLDLGAAADIASNILSAFRLEVAETSRVVDVLSYAANNSNTDVYQLGEAMKFVAPVAAGLGVPIEETAAAVGSLSGAGLQASLAGTGLRRVLSELANPSDDLAALMGDVSLEVDGLTATLRQLRSQGVSTGRALELFGDRGGPAFEILVNNIPSITEMTGELERAGGTAERTSEIMDDNLNGSLLAVRSAAEAVIISFGNLQGTGLQDAMDGVAGALRALADNAETVTAVIGTLTAVYAANRAMAIAAALSTTTFGTALQLLTVQGGAAIVMGQTLNAVLRAGPWALLGAGIYAVNALVRENAGAADLAAQANQDLIDVMDRSSDLREQEIPQTREAAAARLEETLAVREQIRSELELSRARAESFRNQLQRVANDPTASPAQRAMARGEMGGERMRALLDVINSAQEELNRNIDREYEIRNAIASIMGEARAETERAEEPVTELSDSVQSLVQRLERQRIELEEGRVAAALYAAEMAKGSELTEAEARAVRDAAMALEAANDQREKSAELLAAENAGLSEKLDLQRQLTEEAEKQAAIEEEGQIFGQQKEDINRRSIGLGGGFGGEGPLEQLRIDYENRLEIINEHERIINDALINYEEERSRIAAEYSAERNQIILSSASEGFGSLAQIVGAAAGETSAAYRVLFGISKGFAIAESIIAIQQSIAKAAALGFPQNIPIMAQAAAQGASIVQTITSTQPRGFEKGGLVTGGRQVIQINEAGEEFVTNAVSTRRFRPQLEAMNQGKNPFGGVKIQVINNAPGVRHEVQQIGEGEIRVIAREEVARGAGPAVARDMDNPNSPVSKGLRKNVQADRRRD